MKKSNLIRALLAVLVLVLALTVVLTACGKKEDSNPTVVPPSGEQKQKTTFRYEHDPRDNPSAMADIVVDEYAIYGFRPSTTGSLHEFANDDWTDPEIVAEGRARREAYHKDLESLYDIFEQMTAEGADIETIARAVSAERNRLRLEEYKGDPEQLQKTKERNLEEYGNENGPTPEFLYNKYGSWEKVLTKAFSTNSGMDACLGLYDDYYSLYVAEGQITA